MAVRTRAYRAPKLIDPANSKPLELRAIRVTEKNYKEIVAWVNRNGGEAKSEELVLDNGDIYNHKIVIKQWNAGKGWRKQGQRVARVGDFIVRWPDGTYARIKEDDFERDFVLVK